MYFCFPAAVLPQIHVQGGKCTCLSSFLLTPLHASNICFVLFCLLLCLLVWGLFLRASENHRIGKKKKPLQPFIRCCLRHESLRNGVPGWDTRSCPQPAPAARAPLLQCRLAVHSVRTFHAEIRHDAGSQIKQHLP